MIKQESRAYFKALGAHVSMLRKSRGMTQAELARAIGVSQQAVFAYELGERRISVLVLAKLARIFSTPVGDLVGLSTPVRERKGRLSPRCVRHAAQLGRKCSRLLTTISPSTSTRLRQDSQAASA